MEGVEQSLALNETVDGILVVLAEICRFVVSVGTMSRHGGLMMDRIYFRGGSYECSSERSVSCVFDHACSPVLQPLHMDSWSIFNLSVVSL